MCDKKKKNKKKRKKKLNKFLKSHISGMREAISLKFGMWSAAVGGHVHSKNRLVSSRKHRATEVRKLRFLYSCQYTHGCYAPASWAARHTTVCLDFPIILSLDYMCLYIVNTLYHWFQHLPPCEIVNLIKHRASVGPIHNKLLV